MLSFKKTLHSIDCIHIHICIILFQFFITSDAPFFRIVYRTAKDMERLCAEWVTYLRNLMVIGSVTEVGELIDNFNDMVRELDGIELFRSDFINNFSHEFKTPIVSIRGFAKELQQGDLSEEERQEYARIIAEEAGRLAKLSTDVLELSKLENQQIVGDKTAFYLDEQLRQCILRQEPLWTAKQLEILPELDAVRFCFNEEMLAHVWTNLLSNAIKFTPEGGTVRVVLLDEGESVLVRVEDTGIGMTPDVQAHIFEKFYQGDPSHHQKGYGIGLSLVDRIVRLGGGTVTVESEVGKGTTFSVRLPKS